MVFFLLYGGVFTLLFYLHRWLRLRGSRLCGVSATAAANSLGGQILAGFWHPSVRGVTPDRREYLVKSSSPRSALCGLPIGVFNFLVVLAFELHLPLAVGFLLVVVQAFAVMSPASPGLCGHLSRRQCGPCLSLVGSDHEVALGVALVMHAITFVLTIGMGLVYLWAVGQAMRDFGHPDRRIAVPPAGRPLASPEKWLCSGMLAWL